jgi:hypothetical protein
MRASHGTHGTRVTISCSCQKDQSEASSNHGKGTIARLKIKNIITHSLVGRRSKPHGSASCHI